MVVVLKQLLVRWYKVLVVAARGLSSRRNRSLVIDLFDSSLHVGETDASVCQALHAVTPAASSDTPLRIFNIFYIIFTLRYTAVQYINFHTNINIMLRNALDCKNTQIFFPVHARVEK